MLGFVLVAMLGLTAGVWCWWNLSPSWRGPFHRGLEPLEDDSDDEPLPRAAIICPGRNEAAHLYKTLPELAEQDYPRLQVVFVDDDSTDDTPNITADCGRRYPHLIVVRNDQEPPTGWVGKCWAVHRGYAALSEHECREAADRGGRADPPPTERASFVCFTDADIHWHPRCLRSAVRFALEHDTDVVALFPRLEFGSAAERLVQSVLFLGLFVLFPLDKAVDPAYPDVVLTGGAFILVRRELYDRIGGHESVRACVIDDLNLGLNLKRAGGRIQSFQTRDLLRCRMYEGWADMWEGFTKNVYAGLSYRPDKFIAFFVATAWLWVLPPFVGLAAAIWAIAGGGAPAWTAAGLAAMSTMLQGRLMNRMRCWLALRWYYSLVAPIGSAIVLLIAAASVWRYYSGGNVWKGRRYGRKGAQTAAGS